MLSVVAPIALAREGPRSAAAVRPAPPIEREPWRERAPVSPVFTATAAAFEFGPRAIELARTSATSSGAPDTEPGAEALDGAATELPSAAAALRSESVAPEQDPESGGTTAGEDSPDEGRGDSASSQPGEAELSADQERQLKELTQRDREVRVHEQAHKSVGGPYAGTIRLDFEVGPDGKRYAVGGSVPIDVSPVRGDPEATLRKMEVVRRAALAPADPSGADRRVAAQAARTAQRARAQLAAERYSNTQQLAAEQTESETQGDEGERDAGLPSAMTRAAEPPRDHAIALGPSAVVASLRLEHEREAPVPALAAPSPRGRARRPSHHHVDALG